MVRAAQSERSPLIRVADRYSGIFTVITLLLAGFAYSISRDFHQVLAVLVIATPCPLILAAPIALMGGMNALANKKLLPKPLQVSKFFHGSLILCLIKPVPSRWVVRGLYSLI